MNEIDLFALADNNRAGSGDAVRTEPVTGNALPISNQHDSNTMKPKPVYIPAKSGCGINGLLEQAHDNNGIYQSTGITYKAIDPFPKESDYVVKPGAMKLLIYIVSVLTIRGVGDGRLSVKLSDYMHACGYDTGSDAERKRDPKKAALYKKAVRDIKEALGLLYGLDLYWKEEQEKSSREWHTRILSAWGVDGGYFHITLAPDYAKYLNTRRTLFQFPKELMHLDNRKSNAYRIGLKMAHHGTIRANQLRNPGENAFDTLKVKTLLRFTNLPTIDHIRKNDRGHWVKRIKEPFEKALDTLVEEGILKSWNYATPKGRQMDPGNGDYYQFENLNLQFLLNNKPHA